MSQIAELAQKARESGNPNLLMEGIPYARLLGMRMESDGTFHLPPKKSNIGNPTLPAIHGGALGGFMEMCGITHVMMAMEVIQVPKVVDFSIDYVRAGLFQDTYAVCEMFVLVESWRTSVLWLGRMISPNQSLKPGRSF